MTPAEAPSQQGKKKGAPPRAEDSDTDPDAPVAQQLLSFVMDDPDFESEASDTPRISKVRTPPPPCAPPTLMPLVWFFPGRVPSEGRASV